MPRLHPSLSEEIANAEKNEGESEVREAMVKKCEYLTSIGDKEASLKMLKETLDKTTTTGHKLDLHFHMIRLGLFCSDNKLITVNLDKAKEWVWNIWNCYYISLLSNEMTVELPFQVDWTRWRLGQKEQAEGLHRFLRHVNPKFQRCCYELPGYSFNLHILRADDLSHIYQVHHRFSDVDSWSSGAD